MTKKLSILLTALILILTFACPVPASMYGAAGRRPQYWWDLGQNDDSALGGRLGTHVRASTATYWDPDNSDQVTSAATDALRHERKSGLLALLDEPAGTNLIQYSHELGNVASGGWWFDTRLTSVTADGMLGPDGTMSADGLVGNVQNDTHGIKSALLIGIGQNDKVAFTAFAKPGNNDWCWLFVDFYDVGDVSIGDNGRYYFDISSGTVGTKNEVGDVTIHDYKIEEAANDFYRIGMIISNADANTSKVTARLYSCETDNDPTFIGDTTTVNTWLWGADLKKQAYFDSYVPTSGATATRATESGYPQLGALPSGVFDAQGTLIISLYHGAAYGDYSAGDYGIVSFNGAAKSGLYLDENGNICTYDSTNETTHNVNWSKDVWRKYALTWDQATSAVQVGVDTGSGISLTGGTFDGAYDESGSILSLNYGLFARRHLRTLMIDNKVWSDSMIDAWGSP